MTYDSLDEIKENLSRKKKIFTNHRIIEIYKLERREQDNKSESTSEKINTKFISNTSHLLKVFFIFTTN